MIWHNIIPALNNQMYFFTSSVRTRKCLCIGIDPLTSQYRLKLDTGLAQVNKCDISQTAQDISPGSLLILRALPSGLVGGVDGPQDERLEACRADGLVLALQTEGHTLQGGEALGDVVVEEGQEGSPLAHGGQLHIKHGYVLVSVDLQSTQQKLKAEGGLCETE